MKTQISKKLVSSPTLIQFAKDYKFEEAWKIQPNFSIKSDDIRKYLDDNFESICVEFFVKDQLNKTVVFGFTYNEEMKVKGKSEFISKCAKLANRYQEFEVFIEDVESEIIGDGTKLYVKEPDFIRIGILDFWFSTGPAVVWQSGNKKEVTLNTLKNKMEEWPAIIETDLNVQGISWFYGRERCGVDHWIMWECGKQKREKYVLDYERVMDLLNDLL